MLGSAMETPKSSSNKNDKPREFTLNTKNLNLLFHKATTSALLQSKARKELRLLPKSEHLAFEVCAGEAKNLLQLAKCVSAIFDARQRYFEAAKVKNCETTDNLDGNWLFSMWIWLKDRVLRSENGCGQDTPPTKNNSLPQLSSSKYSHFSQRKRYEKVRRLRHRPKINSILIDPKQLRQKREVPQSFATPIKKQRNFAKTPNKCWKPLPENVKILKDVEKYFEKLNKVIGYVYEVSKSNERFFNDANFPLQFSKSPDHTDQTRRQLNQFVSQLESFDDKAIVSILSPKLLNLLPQTPVAPDPESKQWLSPNMLSFQDEGMLPLPRLLQMSVSNHCETLEWLDLLLHMSGASKMLQSMTRKFEGHMKQVEDEVYPRFMDSKKHEGKFERLLSLNTDQQRQDLLRNGYSQLSSHQLHLAYGQGGIHHDLGDDFHQIYKENEKDIEVAFEEEIRQIGKMTEEEFRKRVIQENKKGRRKRDLIDQILPMTTQRQIGGYRLLQPFAFTQRIRNANIMGPYILSPYAYFLQLFAPTVLGAEILSPRAFIATIFSPIILTARVLSPAAFRMMLFSPLALVVWVMVPESFSVKLFAPKLLEARILSPDSMSFVLLSPAAGITFATYQLFSGNRNVIQILSPGILGIDQKPLLKEPLDEARDRQRAGRPPIPVKEFPPGAFPFLPPVIPSIFPPQIPPPSLNPFVPSIFPPPNVPPQQNSLPPNVPPQQNSLSQRFLTSQQQIPPPGSIFPT